MSTTATAPIVNAPSTMKFGDFGNSGRYSPVMESCFESCKTLFKLTPEHADKVCRQIGSDLGKFMPNIKGVNFGKLGKDGKVSMKDIPPGAVKGVTLTYALTVYRAIRYLDDAYGFGISREPGFTPNEVLATALAHFKP
jgi:hypothetical protein